MNKKRIQITISGWVQGVGFRYWAMHTARSIGVKGYVKNQADGSVFIEAEGAEVQLNTFVKACYQGPSHAQVSAVNYTNCKELMNFRVFDIL